MPTNPTTPELLSESDIAKIEKWKTNSYGSMVNLPVVKRDALCQSLRAAKKEAFFAFQAHAKLEAENTALREQLAEREHERNMARREVRALRETILKG